MAAGFSVKDALTKHYTTKRETASPFRYSRAYSEK